MADTTTGRDPSIRKPNSPFTLMTHTVLLHSKEVEVIVVNIIMFGNDEEIFRSTKLILLQY